VVPLGADEATLPVFHATDSTWQPVGEPCSGGVPDQDLSPDPCISARDTFSNTITIKTTQFSLFGLGAPTAIQVQIDIMPNTFPNLINLKSKGLIAVAILSTSSFDARTVDPSSVCFGDNPPDPLQSDCTEAHGRGHISDVDGDGDKDLVLHYETQQTGIDPGDTRACLTGTTFGGTAIEGCDDIRTVGGTTALSQEAALETLGQSIRTWLATLSEQVLRFW